MLKSGLRVLKSGLRARSRLNVNDLTSRRSIASIGRVALTLHSTIKNVIANNSQIFIAAHQPVSPRCRKWPTNLKAHTCSPKDGLSSFDTTGLPLFPNLIIVIFGAQNITKIATLVNQFHTLIFDYLRRKFDDKKALLLL